MIRRVYYKDLYNASKIWEVSTLCGGYYLRQYICGRQVGQGVRITKKRLIDLGILDMERCWMELNERGTLICKSNPIDERSEFVMNNARRKKLKEIKDRLETVSSEIDTLRDEEQDSLDNMPENLQCSTRADDIQEKIDMLEEIYDNITTAIEGIEEVIL